MPKTAENNISEAVALNDWTVKLGGLEGFKGYFCVFWKC
jgi:hypothetical protein